MHLKILSCFLLFFTFQLSAEIKCTLAAEHAILINADTGAILFEKKASTPAFPASITKVATALYALKQKGDCLDTMIAAESEAVASISPSEKRKKQYKQPSFWLETGASHIGIKKGEKLTLKDLMYATLVASANDASNVIAQYVGKGSIDTFMEELNSYLKSIGCLETNFTNPHGLHHPDHKTSARDMARITRYALKIPLFKEIVSTKNYVVEKTNKQPSRTLVQTNQLIKKGTYRYEKAIGVKTGYTSDAGHSLVAAAKQGDRTLIAVVMGCSERKETYRDVTALFDAAFEENKVKKRILKKGKQAYKKSLAGASSPLKTELLADLDLEYYPSEESSQILQVQWKEHLAVPIKKGDPVAIVSLQNSEAQSIVELPLVACEDVKETLWFSAKRMFQEHSLLSGGSFLAGISFVTIGTFLWFKARK